MITTLNPSHLDNIESEETLIVDGKTYKKITLMFVDSLDFRLGQYLEKLEAEYEKLENENEKLLIQFYEQERLLNHYLTINKNLIDQNLSFKITCDKISEQLEEYRKKAQIEKQCEKEANVKEKELIYLYKGQLNDLEMKNSEYKRIIFELKSELAQIKITTNEKLLKNISILSKEIQVYKKTITEQEKKMEKYRLEKANEKPKFQKMSEKNYVLEKEIKLLKSKIESHQKTINQQNEIITTLSARFI
jgi:chromosome segregation ATPase